LLEFPYGVAQVVDDLRQLFVVRNRRHRRRIQ
jgi:hypothetical protein